MFLEKYWGMARCWETKEGDDGCCLFVFWWVGATICCPAVPTPADLKVLTHFDNVSGELHPCLGVKMWRDDGAHVCCMWMHAMVSCPPFRHLVLLVHSARFYSTNKADIGEQRHRHLLYGFKQRKTLFKLFFFLFSFFFSVRLSY